MRTHRQIEKNDRRMKKWYGRLNYRMTVSPMTMWMGQESS